MLLLLPATFLAIANSAHVSFAAVFVSDVVFAAAVDAFVAAFVAAASRCCCCSHCCCHFCCCFYCCCFSCCLLAIAAAVVVEHIFNWCSSSLQFNNDEEDEYLLFVSSLSSAGAACI